MGFVHQPVGAGLDSAMVSTLHVGVSVNNVTPKWMVYDGKPY